MKNNSSSKAGIIIGTLIISIALFSGLGFLLVSKNVIVLKNAQVENAYIDAGTFNVQLTDSQASLPGVISRKKQVVPAITNALAG